MRIAVGNDHGGYPLRTAVLELLEQGGHQVIDFGIPEPEPCDFVDYARQVALAVRDGQADLGVLMCGTGVGMSIAANKIDGAYAAHCHDTYTARMARRHNAANIITLGGRVVGPELAKDILSVFLETEPSADDRYQRRRRQVVALEAER